MSEIPMVDRVKQAIIASRNLPDGCVINEAAFERDARAAIRAMREPTGEMVTAGVKFALGVSLGGDYRWPDYIADMHRLQIDAALAVPEEGREP